MHPRALREHLYDMPACLLTCGIVPQGWAEKRQPYATPVATGTEAVDLTDDMGPQTCADTTCVDLTNDVQGPYGETLVDGFVVVYTDGASRGNQFRSARAAGLGGFWCARHPFNFSAALEGEIQTNDGAELAAVLWVFQLELRPVEVRTDSAYVANGILKHRGAWRKEGWKKKGRTIRNADLWKQLDDLLGARGPASYKLTKVKGHATEEDVARGAVAQADKVGNDEADTLAVAGALRRFDPESLETIATAMNIQRMMVEIYAARADAASKARSPSPSSSGGSHSDTGSDRFNDSANSKTNSSCSRSSSYSSSRSSHSAAGDARMRSGRSAPGAPD